jgi:hypothetical protein
VGNQKNINQYHPILMSTVGEKKAARYKQRDTVLSKLELRTHKKVKTSPSPFNSRHIVPFFHIVRYYSGGNWEAGQRLKISKLAICATVRLKHTDNT